MKPRRPQPARVPFEAEIGRIQGPLGRELISLQVLVLVDFMSRSRSLAYPRASGFSDFEWRVLWRVCDAPGVSINDLSGLVHRGVAQVSRTVKRLVAAGVLHRATRAGGPGVRISPTRLGRTVYAALVELARERNTAIVAGISKEDLNTLDRCIAVMTENARAQLAREVAWQSEDGEQRSESRASQ
jgi:DNA-binding MarR family transcriptional regulator